MILFDNFIFFFFYQYVVSVFVLVVTIIESDAVFHNGNKVENLLLIEWINIIPTLSAKKLTKMCQAKFLSFIRLQ